MINGHIAFLCMIFMFHARDIMLLHVTCEIDVQALNLRPQNIDCKGSIGHMMFQFSSQISRKLEVYDRKLEESHSVSRYKPGEIKH